MPDGFKAWKPRIFGTLDQSKDFPGLQVCERYFSGYLSGEPVKVPNFPSSIPTAPTVQIPSGDVSQR